MKLQKNRVKEHLILLHISMVNVISLPSTFIAHKRLGVFLWCSCEHCSSLSSIDRHKVTTYDLTQGQTPPFVYLAEIVSNYFNFLCCWSLTAFKTVITRNLKLLLGFEKYFTTLNFFQRFKICQIKLIQRWVANFLSEETGRWTEIRPVLMALLLSSKLGHWILTSVRISIK